MHSKDIKAYLKISQVLDFYEIPHKKYSGNESINCCFHEDKNPSLSISYTKNQFFCFGCGAKGSVIDFVMKKQGLDFKLACSFITKTFMNGSENIVYNQNRSNISRSKSSKSDHAKISTKDKIIYKTLYDYLNLSKKASSYLNSYRNLKPKIVEKWGLKSIDSVSSTYKFLKSNFDDCSLIHAGLLSENHNAVFFAEGIIIPFFINGNIIYMQERFFKNKGRIKYVFPAKKNKMPLIGKYSGGDIFVFEGPFDAICFSQLTGYDNVMSAGGIIEFNTYKITKKLNSLGFNNVNIIFCPDNDEAGLNAIKKEAKYLNVRYIDLANFCKNHNLNICKDWGEIMIK